MTHIRRVTWTTAILTSAGVALAHTGRAQEGAVPPAGSAVIGGQVTAADGGAPIPGATVALLSLHVGAVTRPDGQYSFTVPGPLVTGQSVTLNARSIGFKEKTTDIVLQAGSITENFALDVSPLKLGEIVVTGEGTTARAAELATARGHVDAPEIQKSNEPNITTALAAKAPGVNITSTAGDPGASTQILIRGVNTLGGGTDRPAQPLFVVDGVPVDNSAVTPSFLDPQASAEGGAASPNRAVDINPDDIASIEILKGAAAGAIYGARAGQGVVLITTKHGRSGLTRYSLNSSAAFDSPHKFERLQRSFGQGSVGTSDPCALGQSGLDCLATADSWGPLLPTGTHTFDHASEPYTHGNTFNNTLTVSGGNERTTFYVAGSYLSQRGTVVGPNNYLKRSSVRLTADHRIVDRLTVGGNVTVAETNQGGVQKGFNFSAIPWTAALASPEFNDNPYLDRKTGLQRSYTWPFPSAGSALLGRGFDNPLWSANTAISTTHTPRTFGDLHAEYDASNWLKLTYQLGLDNAQDSRLQGQDQSNSNSLSSAGQVIVFNFTHKSINQDIVATASLPTTDHVAGSLALGSNLNSLDSYENGQVGDVLLTPGLYALGNVKKVRFPFSNEEHQRVAGLFSQGRLDLEQAVFLQAGLRYDGASTYSAGQLWAWFPSASAAWEFTKATGSVGPINYGKLRAAYGEVGTQPSPYLYANVLETTREYTNGYGGLFLGTQGLGGLASPLTEAARNLRPERTSEAEGGFDLGLFGDVSDLNFTLYRRTSRDVILATPVAASAGHTDRFANGAKIQNQGGELGINIRPITTRTLQWTVGLLGSINHTKVLSLQGANFVTYGQDGGFGLTYAVVGNSVGAFRDLDYVRCGRGITLFQGSTPYSVDAHCSSAQMGAHALFLTDGNLTTANGDPGNGPGFPLVDPTPRLIGNPDPKFTASISNQLKIGKVTLSALVDVRRGGLVYNGTRAVTNFYGTGWQTLRRNRSVIFGTNYMPGVGSGRGTVAGPGAGTMVTLDQNWFQAYNGGVAPAPIGFPFYEDGSFTKLREVSVTYDFTGPAITRLGLGSIDLRVSGRNLFVWSGYTGVDPEVNAVGSETGARNIDYFGNPQTRSVIVSVILSR